MPENSQQLTPEAIRGNPPKDMTALVKEVDAGVLLHPSSSTVKYSAADATTSLEEQHALAGGLSENIPQPVVR
ncbi:MAG: hypothetical protein RIQ94_3317 [Pseudomonadota bacterium]|jgi:hypothetical protein